jgi:hypothetical protein
MAWWHSLMYSTAYLILLGGLPAAMLLSALMLVQQPLLTALRIGAVVAGCEILIAVPLLLAAKWLTRRQEIRTPPA